MLEQNEGPELEQPTPQTALCLSGGGYRAMLFHVGVLWRLNECGMLSRIDRFSSVSGGSIVAGFLWLKWHELGLQVRGAISPNFDHVFVAPLRRLAGKMLDAPAILLSLSGLRQAGNVIAASYQRHLFGNTSLRDLPEVPRFVINATNLQSGALWRFSKPYMRDYRVGKIANPDIPLAVAVAASSAFPPFLSPVRLDFDESQFEADSGSDLQHRPYTTRVYLADGGIYDNLGLETVKQCRTVLVSDGGGKMSPMPTINPSWASQAYRVNNLIDNQVRSLRKRQLIAAFQQGIQTGTYWGIRTNIQDYQVPDALVCPLDKTLLLAEAPTRLAPFAPVLQEKLINWGYAVCDAAVRKHVEPVAPTPNGFPYPAAGVG